jgi:hypothetical protein
MHFRKLKQGIILPVLAILVTSTILRFPSGSDRYVYSQSSKTNSTTANATSSGADLINIHPSPTNLKAGSKFEVIATVVNNSPTVIMFVAGACHSPLSAFFYRNVHIMNVQGCTATSPPFKLDPGKEVTVAGPGSGTIYQTISSGQTRATATLYYQIEHGGFANITKSFLFTIS